MHLCDACWAEEEDSFSEFEDDFWAEGDPLSLREIEKENEYMLKRQEDFRKAAEYVSSAFALVPEVEKVALFGSVDSPLWKEVPRFRPYRKAGVEIWHECKDVDMAVWVSDLRGFSAWLGDHYILNTNEFALQVWFPIFKEHLNDLFKIAVQLVKRIAL